MVRLQYDDPAFYIFAISVLSVYALPATYLVLGKILRSVSAKPASTRRPLKGEEEKSQQLKKKMAAAVWTPCFVAHLTVLALVWVLLFVLLTSYSAGGCVRSLRLSSNAIGVAVMCCWLVGRCRPRVARCCVRLAVVAGRVARPGAGRRISDSGWCAVGEGVGSAPKTCRALLASSPSSPRRCLPLSLSLSQRH